MESTEMFGPTENTVYWRLTRRMISELEYEQSSYHARLVKVIVVTTGHILPQTIPLSSRT